MRPQELSSGGGGGGGLGPSDKKYTDVCFFLIFFTYLFKRGGPMVYVKENNNFQRPQMGSKFSRWSDCSGGGGGFNC